ncbi:DUF58 domain-containing protein [Sandaracinus amylolyticus]|uniref:DUF58 domain-containing protein n=1 Tax=Sandaracinus amylolyticus TaxID=927083 RepID=A0A0F6SFW8_9BACT|nr:DUF58 domain-containing protein [Sandaracinus amylolyticus]AKF07669.1 hypothetical protein DB32_004818 [Sandaracinus amylolyticus]
MSSSLLEPEFLRRLARLRLAVRRRFAGATSGARRSRNRGSSAEFAEHRPYFPGDDVRRIDWNAYARLEELVLRLFVAEEDLSLYLLVDTSASMGLGAPRKIDVAKRLAAGLGYVGLSGSERVAVMPFAARLSRPLPASRGRKRVGPLLRFLDELEPSGDTDLARGVDEFLARSPRPGLVVVLSDFLDPRGFTRPLDRLIAEKHEPVLFHVLDREELDPTPGGDLELVDSETGRKVEVSLDARAVRAYRQRLATFLVELESYAKKRGLFYGRVGEGAFEDVLVEYLARGTPGAARAV